MGGTGLTNSFGLFVSKDATPEVMPKFKYLLAHEHFHNWNGRVIHRQDPEELVYWFSEGFTNHFTHRLGVRAGLFSLEEFLSFFNERALKKYYSSPARNMTNQDVLRDFWNDRFIERLPYQRGDLLGHLWNHRIKARNSAASIDSMMLNLYREARSQGTVVSKESIDRLIRGELSEGIAQDVERFVEQGETVILPADLFGSCFFRQVEQDAEGKEYPQYYLKDEFKENTPDHCYEYFR